MEKVISDSFKVNEYATKISIDSNEELDEIYQDLKEGVKVTFLDDDGKQQTERIKVVDWKRPSNNHFLIIK